MLLEDDKDLELEWDAIQVAKGSTHEGWYWWAMKIRSPWIFLNYDPRKIIWC